APSPAKRFETMRAVADAGIETTIGIAPLIPALNESDVPELLARAKEAGATHAFMTLLRLAGEVLPVFRERLAESFPDRAKHIESAILDMRGGRMNRNDFGERMHGSGPRWDAVSRLFDIHCRRNGLNVARVGEETSADAPTPRQHELF